MSTARFMLLWAVSAAPVYLAWGWWNQELDEGAVSYFAGVGATALALGVVQYALLRRYRARVRFWPLALLAGWLGSSALSYPVFNEVWALFSFPADYRKVQLIHVAIWGVTQGVCVGTALGLAIWGRRWNSAWPLWITGLVILETASALVLIVLFPYALFAWPIEGALVMAGMGWLLDRLVFEPGRRGEAAPEA